MEPLNSNNAPVLFYTSSRRIFRSILIGHLYQICQTRNVVLLTEELDSELDNLLLNRNLFPGIIEQVKIGQFKPEGEGIIARHWRMSKIALDLVEAWRPIVVFVPGVNLFEHYLRRYAKQKLNAFTIDCIGWLGVRSNCEIPLLLDLHIAEERFPAWLPQSLRLALARTRRQLSQFVCYMLTPLLAGRAPFWGVNGIYRLDYTQLRNADVSVVFTRANQEMLVREGAPANKIRVISHPMKSRLPDEVKAVSGFYLPNIRQVYTKVLTCFLDVRTHWGFTRNTLVPIPDEVLDNSKAEVIKIIVKNLPFWEVRIKPHPMSRSSKNYKTAQQKISQISDNVIWISPDEPAEDHILSSDVIIGFPPASAALYSAAIVRAGMPVFMVDINRELRGDGFIGVDGVVTVTSLLELEEQIKAVADGVWCSSLYSNDQPDFETLEQLVASHHL